MKTRTKSDPDYKEINKIATRRVYFRKSASWEWIKKNHPEIAQKIWAESYKKWPSPKENHMPSSVDLDFLEEE